MEVKRRGALWLSLIIIAAVGCGGGAPEEDAAAPSAAPASPGESAPAAGTPAPAGGTAVISGTVRYEGDVPKLAPIRMNADPGCMAKHTDPVAPEVLVLGQDGALANVLVRVTAGLGDAAWPPPVEPVVMDQQGCRYIPHVMGVMVGQTFKILNSDGLLHNVHSLPEINKSFNRAMPANQTEAEFTFSKVEAPFKIKCDVHPWMSAYVAVLSHPYYAVSDTGGTFRIAGLPAGDYQIEAWHERLGTQTAQVSLTDGGTGQADFKFTR